MLNYSTKLWLIVLSPWKVQIRVACSWQSVTPIEVITNFLYYNLYCVIYMTSTSCHKTMFLVMIMADYILFCKYIYLFIYILNIFYTNNWWFRFHKLWLITILNRSSASNRKPKAKFNFTPIMHNIIHNTCRMRAGGLVWELFIEFQLYLST